MTLGHYVYVRFKMKYILSTRIFGVFQLGVSPLIHFSWNVLINQSEETSKSTNDHRLLAKLSSLSLNLRRFSEIFAIHFTRQNYQQRP